MAQNLEAVCFTSTFSDQAPDLIKGTSIMLTKCTQQPLWSFFVDLTDKSTQERRKRTLDELGRIIAAYSQIGSEL